MDSKELRSKFEEETKYKAIGKNGTYHSKYGKWLEDKLVKNCSIPDVVGQSEQLKTASTNMEECDMCGRVNELGYDKCKGCGL